MLRQAGREDVELYMNRINLLEIYYGVYREEEKERADAVLHKIAYFPIQINSDLNNELFNEAGRLKATYKISLAESIALAEASTKKASLVTSDHHEFNLTYPLPVGMGQLAIGPKMTFVIFCYIPEWTA